MDQITAIWDGKPFIVPINEVEIRNAIKAYELLEILNQNNLEDLLKAHFTMEVGLIDDAGISVVRVLVWLQELLSHIHRPLHRINLISLRYITIM